jgi:hypothetical protein
MFAYCLMSNHVHLVLEEGKEPISMTMKRMGVRYAGLYNRKYDRVGPLFQGRFISEAVEDDAYFQTVLLYVHHNPVSAGLCKEASQYRWSSRPTLGRESSLVDLARLEAILPLPTLFRAEAGYSTAIAESLGVSEVREAGCRVTDDEAWLLVASLSGVGSSSDFQRLDRAGQQAVVQAMRAHQLPVRQISRVTGISSTQIIRWSVQ